MKGSQLGSLLRTIKLSPLVLGTVALLSLFSWTLHAQTYKTIGSQNVAVFMVNFRTNPNEKPWTRTQVNSFIFSDVNNLFKENSYQQFSITGKAYDWITLDMDGGTCPSGISSEVDKTAAAMGVDYGLYDQIVTHEMLHNLGLGHSKALDCEGGTLGTNCSTIEYGDSYDLMGASLPGQLNSFHKEKLGWLNTNQSPPLLQVTSSGHYLITPIETNDNNIKALKIFKGLNPATGKKVIKFTHKCFHTQGHIFLAWSQ